jgi:hypothetical protein
MSAQPTPLRTLDAGPRNAIGLVRAYVSKPDPRVRRNAIAALAAIGGDDAIEALVDLALKERERDVLHDAEKALVTLDGSAGTVRRRLIARLKAHPSATADLVPLIVQLRSKGARWSDPEIMGVLVSAAQDGGTMASTAERILAEQHGGDAVHIVNELRRRLESAHVDERERAYALLGRLRRRGAEAAAPEAYARSSPRRPGDLLKRETWKRLWRWTRMVGSVATSPQAMARRPISWSLVWAAIGGTATAAVMVALYLASTLTPEAPGEFYPVLLLVTPILGFMLSVLATRWATPAYLQFDRVTSAIIDAVAAGLWVLLPVLFTLGALLFLLGLKEDIIGWTILLVFGTAVTCTFVGAIRLGSAIGFGGLVAFGANASSPIGRSSRRASMPEHIRPRRKVLNAIAQWVTGTAAGLIVLGVTLFLGRRLFPPDTHRSLSLLIEGLWVTLVPTAAGIAGAFAVLDWPAAESEKDLDQQRGNRARWLQRAACWALIAVFAGSLVAGVVRAASRTQPTDIAVAGEDSRRDQLISRFPTTTYFRAGFLQKVQIEMPGDESRDRSPFGLDLYQHRAIGRTEDGLPICDQRSDRMLLGMADGPQRLEQWLGWGCYSVDVIELSGESAAGVRESIIQALEARASRGGIVAISEGANVVQLRTVLNAAKDRPVKLADGNPSWRIESLPSTMKIEITQPTTLLARLSPPSDFRGRRATATTAGPSPAGSVTVEEDKPEFVLTLSTESGDKIVEVQTRPRTTPNPEPMLAFVSAAVVPGTYTLQVERADKKKELKERFLTVDLLMEGAPPPAPEKVTLPPFEAAVPAAAPGQVLAGAWAVTTVPQRFKFAVKFPQTIVATVPTIGMPGFRGDTGRPVPLELKIYQEGKILDTFLSQPDVLQKQLEPGQYELEVTSVEEVLKIFSALVLTPKPVVQMQLNANASGMRISK